MKSKKFLKIDLFLLVIIGILASFTFNPTNAKFFKKLDEALKYSAKFNQMGDKAIVNDAGNNMGLQSDSTADIIHYKFMFDRSTDMKDRESDTYTLSELSSNSCDISFFDGTINRKTTDNSITFNDISGKGKRITVGLSCKVADLVDDTKNNIKLPLVVNQQFTNVLDIDGNIGSERVYKYVDKTFEVSISDYLADKNDKLDKNIIYLIKTKNNDIYSRFFTLLKDYVKNNKVNYGLILSDETLESLLDEYLKSILTNNNLANLKVEDLLQIQGIIKFTTTDYIYNELEITEEFKNGFINYLNSKVDKIENNIIYLRRNDITNIYNRFVDLLKIYAINNKDSINEDLDKPEVLNHLLNKYLDTTYFASTDKNSLTIEDLSQKVDWLSLESKEIYNELTIAEVFKTEFKNFIDKQDYAVSSNKNGIVIKISNLYEDKDISVNNRIANLLGEQDNNVTANEVNRYIYGKDKDTYNSIDGLTYTTGIAHDMFEVDKYFSSYVKTYNVPKSTLTKKFYFFNNELLNSEEINTLFYKYLNEYLYNENSEEYKTIKEKISEKFRETSTENVIALASKLDWDFFKYNSEESFIFITTKLYDTLVNGVSYDIQKNLSIDSKIYYLNKQFEQFISDKNIREAILNDTNFLKVISIQSGDIDETVNIEKYPNIEVRILSLNDNKIHITITEKASTNDETNGNGGTTNEVVTPPIDDAPSEELAEEPVKAPSEKVNENNTDNKGETETPPNKEEEEEKEKEEVEATDPEVEVDTKTQDEVGIISYPIDSTLDNTLGEEKKYIYIKPEDE